MTKTGRLIALVILPVLAAVGLLCAEFMRPAAAQDDVPRARLLHVEGPITAVVARYIERGIADADDEGAGLVIVRLDTPGGSVQITEGILREIETSPVPVVVWVGPRGAMAASAGTYITLSAHIAAMAPGTSIGAASPVGPKGENLPEVAQRKAVNMLVARITGLADRRGAQAVDWARAAVETGRASTETEVLDLRVIDIVASDIPDLLQQLNGRAITIDGVAVGLATSGMEIEEVTMNLAERGLHIIGSPEIALLLITLGMSGIVYEFANPGIGFAGVAGGICLILGLWAMGTLPVNYAGVALVLVAFGLFFADIKLGTGGLLAIGGVVALVIGGMMLFNSPLYAVSTTVVITTALLIGAFFAFAGRAVIEIRKKQATTGSEGLVGATGAVREELDPDGLVAVWGEVWRATALDGPIGRDEEVEVVEVDKLRLRVRRAAETET